MEQMNPELFTYELYCSNWGALFDMSYESTLDNNQLVTKIKQYAIGYCDSSRVTVRPSPGNYAVMFLKDGVSFWFHIPQELFEKAIVKKS